MGTLEEFKRWTEGTEKETEKESSEQEQESKDTHTHTHTHGMWKPSKQKVARICRRAGNQTENDPRK